MVFAVHIPLCSRTAEIVFLLWAMFNFSAFQRLKTDWNIFWGREGKWPHVKGKLRFTFTYIHSIYFHAWARHGYCTGASDANSLMNPGMLYKSLSLKLLSLAAKKKKINTNPPSLVLQNHVHPPLGISR